MNFLNRFRLKPAYRVALEGGKHGNNAHDFPSKDFKTIGGAVKGAYDLIDLGQKMRKESLKKDERPHEIVIYFNNKSRARKAGIPDMAIEPVKPGNPHDFRYRCFFQEL